MSLTLSQDDRRRPQASASSSRSPWRALAPGIIQGSSIERPVELRAEVLIIGSGASGAVVARELACAGHDVLILEEGRYYSPEQMGQWRPSKAMHRVGRAGGTLAAIGLGDSPTIGVFTGSAYGGSSLLTGGVCFRIPHEVHDAWSQELGVESLSYDAMLPYYELVEKVCNIQHVPESMQSRGTQLFGEGARRLGADFRPMRRNTKNCDGLSKCNYVCPIQAKISVDLSYLPMARQAGALTFTDMRCERLIIEGDRVLGVHGVTLREPDRRPSQPFTVRARHVILCAGALHTPLLLLRSGVGRQSGLVGKNLSLHPGFALAAFFDQEVRTWDGAMQSAYCHQPHEPRMIFNSIAAPPNLLAGFVPGVGQALVRNIRHDLGRMATFGALVHDDSGGQVRRGPGREPLITYRLSRRDRDALMSGIRWGVEAFLAAGAHTVYTPMLGAQPVRSMDDLRRLDLERMGIKRMQSASYHPLGTAQLGDDPKRSVVDPSGRSHEVRGLWVADGSIFPSSVGVNSQLPIMTMATRIACEFLERVS